MSPETVEILTGSEEGEKDENMPATYGAIKDAEAAAEGSINPVWVATLAALGPAAEQEVLYSATVCCTNSCALSRCTVCFELDAEGLCFTQKCCLARGREPFGFGASGPTDDRYCTLSLYACEYGLKAPDKLFNGTAECLCYRQAAAYPFADPVPEPVCAVCFLRCFPASPVGCCMEPFGKTSAVGLTFGGGEGGPPAAEGMLR